jgi:hypothetical protein
MKVKKILEKEVRLPENQIFLTRYSEIELKCSEDKAPLVLYTVRFDMHEKFTSLCITYIAVNLRVKIFTNKISGIWFKKIPLNLNIEI